MNKAELAGFIIGGMMLLIAIRIPLGAAMFAAGAAGYWYIRDYAIVAQAIQKLNWNTSSLVDYFTIPLAPTLFNYLKSLSWSTFSKYDLSVIPLFLMMGQFASAAGFSRNLFRAANAWVGHMRGGVAQAAIVACAAFGAISGSSVATAATMSQVVLPEMKRLNYSDRLATGTLAAGGTLGILVPPSFILIIYAFLAEQSIIKLFAAAVVPGVIAAVFFMIAIGIYVRLYPEHAPAPQIDASDQKKERMSATLEAWPIAAIFILMFTGIYIGWFTATEGAAIGTSATLLLAIVRARIGWRTIVKCVLPAAQASAMIYTMLLGAAMLNTTLALTQVPADLAEWASNLGTHPLLIIGGFLIVFVLLTCVLDELAMMLLFLPVVLPTIRALELWDMTSDERVIWFGILMLVVISIGLIAPPVGLTVYVVANIARNVPIGEIYRGIVPFLISDVFRAILLLYFPILTIFALRFVK
ncbi:MAG: TRAP transporter large permease [Xanthobacteraceae bacterium]|nr:TRAP transporter large permease [Xanthobacteraceae bacterium]QYK45889.1 MAG: TRAP transporter large permease [Xanthobacteraceae bacterium]